MTVCVPKIAGEKNLAGVEKLYRKHAAYCRQERSPEEILAMFYDDQWFQEKLRSSARSAIVKAKGLACCADDIKQDALILVHRALQRRTCLGYDPNKGSYAGFLSTILSRSCQKALWQFRHTFHLAIESETQHPHYDCRQEVDDTLDLLQLIERLDQPYRGVLEAVCQGKSVDEIAACQQKSRRTIYRWLKLGMQNLERRLA